MSAVDTLIADARAVIARGLAVANKPLIAFSGGKDAIAVALLAREFGVVDAVCEESFYFTMQREDTRALVRQLGLRCTFKDSMDASLFVKHPEFLFSRDNAVRSRYFSRRQQGAVAAFARQGGYDAVLFGRRNDTNSVRADVYLKDGRYQVMPIRRWREPDVWKYLRARDVTPPRVYATPYGRNQHNGPWNIYNAHASIRECWRDIYAIEARVVEDAARAGVTSAIDFLQTV